MLTSPIPRTQLISLYNSGKSMTMIANNLNCSIHKVVYWMDKYKIKRRSISDAVYLSQNPTGDPFKIKQNLSMKEERLYGLGIGIYWGEGEKLSKGHVRITNSDANLVLTFREFLIKICQVTVSRIYYHIICFEDSNTDKVSEYWSKILNIPRQKFGKIVQIPHQGKGTYRKKSLYGVCIIGFSSTKLKFWIMNELDRLSKNADMAQW